MVTRVPPPGGPKAGDTDFTVGAVDLVAWALAIPAVPMTRPAANREPVVTALNLLIMILHV
jgi:hypothetical protein